MGESNDSFFENVLSKNIDEDIPINVDLSDTTEKNSVSTMRTSAISKRERYIDKIYDDTVKSELKKGILLDLQHRFSSEKKEANILKSLSKASTIKSPLLKRNKLFTRGIKRKRSCDKNSAHMRCKPSENYGTTSCSNHSSGKSSDRSSNNNNDININISRNKINPNISNNKINNNISNNNNKINNNNNDNIGNIINNNNNNDITNNDNISNTKISNNNIINSNTCNNNVNNNNNNINNINNSNNNISNNYNDINNSNNNNTSNNINNNISSNISSNNINDS